MSKSRPVYRSTDKVVGYGYVGRWIDGQIGWSLPSYLTGFVGDNHMPHHDFSIHEPHTLCKITIEVVPDKNGRDIVRYPGGKPE